MEKEETKKTIDDEVDAFSDDKVIRERGDIEATADIMFDDKVSKEKLSSIDMKTRLNDAQVPNMAITDEMSKMAIIPNANSFTRNIKRLNVSLNGAGRQELVDVATGTMNRKEGVGVMDKVKNVFRPQQNNN